jgi:hypothetical protein
MENTHPKKPKPRFQIGDVVHMDGYGSRRYVVVGFSIEEFHSRDGVDYELVYTLGEEGYEDDERMQIFAYEEDMALADPSQEEEEEPPATVDSLLEEYRDYKILYEMFGDEEYAKRLRDIRLEIIEMTKEGA